MPQLRRRSLPQRYPSTYSWIGSKNKKDILASSTEHQQIQAERMASMHKRNHTEIEKILWQELYTSWKKGMKRVPEKRKNTTPTNSQHIAKASSKPRKKKLRMLHFANQPSKKKLACATPSVVESIWCENTLTKGSESQRSSWISRLLQIFDPNLTGSVVIVREKLQIFVLPEEKDSWGGSACNDTLMCSRIPWYLLGPMASQFCKSKPRAADTLNGSWWFYPLYPQDSCFSIRVLFCRCLAEI